jgi:hypothetical protein
MRHLPNRGMQVRMTGPLLVEMPMDKTTQKAENAAW